MPEQPPAKLLISRLSELLDWYEQNLCAVEIKDPRGHRVKFDLERFAYMIKLRSRTGGKLRKPRKAAAKIKAGELDNEHFGGFDPERASTLPWLSAIVERPTVIASNKSLLIPGDELYVKEFDKSGYRYKVLYCMRVGKNLLVPVSSFPRTKLGTLAIVWP